MGVTQQAMAVSIFVLIIAMSLTATNAFLDSYKLETGKDLIDMRQSSFINETDMGLGVTQNEQNKTITDVVGFSKPQGESFALELWKSINTFGIISQFVYFSTWGFPLFLQNYFLMPAIFTLPMIILINISHLLFSVYLVTGRTF